MVILKKIVIMTEYGKSNCSGIVKFENFAGRTSCFVRILGVKVGGVLCIKCGEDIVYCGDLFEGEKRFNALYDLNKTIQIAALYEGSVVCLGSNRGRFIPTAIVRDIHKYFALHSGAIEQSFASQPIENESLPQYFENTDSVESVDTPDTAETVEETAKVESVETIAPVEAMREEQAAAALDSAAIAQEASTASEKPVAKVKKTIKPAKQEREIEPFYKKIETNMQELFDKNEKDDELTLLIPESKWVRVPTEDDGYYVVGIIYSDDTPNVICYGVPDKDNSAPPQSNENCRQWLELEKGGRGYWMMYQSAANGETLTTSIDV
ncbi:MAG: hypothetical protein K2N57_04630 [Clostridia bacterium]|nr:hypothetical protein [Clostridia bacterium]